tara:strand:+ start:49 stop:282 length:234 start_codon:yes stop_codon:yes gene_type:complete
VISKNLVNLFSLIKKKYFKKIIKNKNLKKVSDLFNEENKSKEKKDIIIKTRIYNKKYFKNVSFFMISIVFSALNKSK